MNLLSFLNIGIQEIIVILLVASPLFLMIPALIHCVMAEFTNPTYKLIWVLVILFLPLIGSLLWFVIGTRQIKKL